MILKHSAAASALALALAIAPLSGQAAALSQNDSTYLQTAIQTQLGRYAIASLGQSKASAAPLKSVATRMFAQAAGDNKLLAGIAKQNGVAPPTKPTMIATYHYSTISGLSGKAFNSQFAQAVLIDDKQALDESKQEAANGSNPQLKVYAKKRVDALQSEIKTVQKFIS